MRRILGKRGDTIVEVLICLTVLGVTMGSATVVVNNNRKVILGSQERAVALKLVQGQIEKTRIITTNNPALLTTSGSVVRAGAGYCIDTTSPPQAVIATNAACTVDRTGMPSTEQPNYALKTVVTTNNGGYLLRSSATWSMPTGVNGNVELVERIYP